MKSKIFFVSILLLLFSASTFAGMCFPESQIYTNINTRLEKYLPCGDLLSNPFGSLLNKFTGFPLPTASFIKTDIAYDFGAKACGGKDTANLSRLTFPDFSSFDKMKIIFNALFFVIILFLPLELFRQIHRHVKSLKLKISFNILLSLAYFAWILFLFLSFGTCV